MEHLRRRMALAVVAAACVLGLAWLPTADAYNSVRDYNFVAGGCGFALNFDGGRSDMASLVFPHKVRRVCNRHTAPPPSTASPPPNTQLRTHADPSWWVGRDKPTPAPPRPGAAAHIRERTARQSALCASVGVWCGTDLSPSR